MSQSVEAPASTGTARNRSRGIEQWQDALAFRERHPLQRARPRALPLVRAARALRRVRRPPRRLAPAGWRRESSTTAEDRKAAEDRYREKLKQFTYGEGEIVAAYWSTTVPSGIVMTVQTPPRKLRNLLSGRISLHRATTW